MSTWNLSTSALERTCKKCGTDLGSSWVTIIGVPSLEGDYHSSCIPAVDPYRPTSLDEAEVMIRNGIEYLRENSGLERLIDIMKHDPNKEVKL